MAKTDRDRQDRQLTQEKAQQRTVFLFQWKFIMIVIDHPSTNDVIELYNQVCSVHVYTNEKNEQQTGEVTSSRTWQISSWLIWGNTLSIIHKPSLQSLGLTSPNLQWLQFVKIYTSCTSAFNLDAQVMTYKALDFSNVLFLQEPNFEEESLKGSNTCDHFSSILWTKLTDETFDKIQSLECAKQRFEFYFKFYFSQGQWSVLKKVNGIF